jgi:hypothetical protein
MTLLKYYGIDWFAIFSSFLAIYLLGNKNRNGFLAFMLSNICYLTIGYLTDSLALIIGSIVFFITNFRGWTKWKKESN